MSRLSKFIDAPHEWATKHPYGPFKEPTFIKHIQHLEDRHAERMSRSLRERTEALSLLITKAAAKSLREIINQANAEVPQDAEQVRKLLLKNPKSGPGLMISAGASVEEVAAWIAKRTLEKWVRVLRPFASGPGLAGLISRLVHEEYHTRQCADSPTAADRVVSLVPPPTDLLGAAFRRLTPTPDVVLVQHWKFLEDLEAANQLEAEFNVNPDHPLRPNTEHKSVSRTSSSMSRPQSVGNLQTMSPKGCSGALRRSGAFPWADFQAENPNR